MARGRARRDCRTEERCAVDTAPAAPRRGRDRGGDRGGRPGEQRRNQRRRWGGLGMDALQREGAGATGGPEEDSRLRRLLCGAALRPWAAPQASGPAPRHAHAAGSPLPAVSLSRPCCLLPQRAAKGVPSVFKQYRPVNASVQHPRLTSPGPADLGPRSDLAPTSELAPSLPAVSHTSAAEGDTRTGSLVHSARSAACFCAGPPTHGLWALHALPLPSKPEGQIGVRRCAGGRTCAAGPSESF